MNPVQPGSAVICASIISLHCDCGYDSSIVETAATGSAGGSTIMSVSGIVVSYVATAWNAV
jgi:hypothetical protein